MPPPTPSSPSSRRIVQTISLCADPPGRRRTSILPGHPCHVGSIHGIEATSALPVFAPITAIRVHREHSRCEALSRRPRSTSFAYKKQAQKPPLHPLVAVGKRTSAVCDACAREQNGYFFMCHECNFWIHVDCALLPRIIKCKKHPHFLILTYTIYDVDQSQLRGTCLICWEKMFGTGAYSCGDYCNMFIHLSCAIEDTEEVGTETDLGVTDLPAADHSWIIRSIPGIKSDGNSAFGHKLHDHDLILYNDTENGGSSSSDNELYLSSEELTCCDACIQPIYPPFYACSQSSRCHFHLHQLCSGLPSSTRVDGYHINFTLRTRSNESLCSLFYCSICFLLGNGLSYYLSEDDELISCYIHITCFFPPHVIRHASHKQHVLHFINDPRDTIKQCCSDPNASIGLYQCFDCHFNIDNRCALLPGKITHKYDSHPLDLITTGIANSDDNYICEFCEEHIDANFWYYGCEECDNLFHVNCIPSVGSLSKVKFGNSINISCHPLHPVTFVRMLGFGSQSCGYRKEIVEGFVDEMAFHCSKCDFWMHFK